MKTETTNYLLTIGWLYPELMSTYGDRGNIITFKKRLEWRNIQANIKHLDIGFNPKELESCDLLFMGGAQDTQQQIVAKDLMEKSKIISDIIHNETPGLYVCGAYQFLGKYYKEANGTEIKGLGILDLYTNNPGESENRLIGNIIIEPSDLISHSYNTQKVLTESERTNPLVKQDPNDTKTNTIVGFENHGGRTYLGNSIKPFAKVIKGFGNNGEDQTEGAVYKNSFGTYLHGPILPKNPHFTDYLLKLALEKKYKKRIELNVLDDTMEWNAHISMVKKIEEK